MARCSAIAGVLLLLLLILESGQVWAGADRPVLELTQAINEIHLLAHSDFIEDRSRTLSIEDVCHASVSARFRALDRDNQGLSRSAFWVRFRLKRVSGPESWILVLSNTANATLYVPVLGGFEAVRSGVGVPFDRRPIQEPLVSFAIQPAREQVVTYYLRLESSDAILLDFRLQPQFAFAASASSGKLAHGLFYGAILALIAYNIGIFAATRDRIYLLYAAFEIPWILLQASMDKYAFQYLWPHAPGWAFLAEQFFGCVSCVGAIAFTSKFLAIDRFAPRLRAPLVAGMALGAAMSILSVFTSHAAFIAATSAYGVVCASGLLALGIALAIGGVPNARLFVMAWSPLAAAGVVDGLNAVGLLQFRGTGTLLKVSSLLDAVLLSVGLALRVDAMRREQHATRAKLARAREERLAALGRLVASLAHEIGNPLNFALGGAAELNESLEAAQTLLATACTHDDATRLAGESIQTARHAAALVIDGGERIRRLLDNLRRYARAGDVDPVATDVHEAITATLALAAPLLERTRTRVARVSAVVPPVHVRPGELEQVLMNLVLNSCQAMGDEGEITIATRVEAGTARIEVSDTGPGVAVSRRDMIFEPFFTTRDDRTGSGLGLYVCQDIVTRHGGQLRLEESPAGARFVIELPLA